MSTTIQKWGNSLGVRIPKHLAQQARLKEGAEVEIAAVDDRIIITPVAVPTLEELLTEIKPNSQPELVNWGRPIGKEVW